MTSFFVFIFLVFINGANLQNVKLEILPKKSVFYGSTVGLKCNYNLATFDNKTGCSIKFFRNEKKIYDYVFGDDMPSLFNPFNITLDFDYKNSNYNEVYIKNVKYKLTGKFTCSVTGAVPRFHTESSKPQLLKVVRPPHEPLNCSCSKNETEVVELDSAPRANGSLPHYFLLEVRGATDSLQISQCDKGDFGVNPDISNNTDYQGRQDEPNCRLRELSPDEYAMAGIKDTRVSAQPWLQRPVESQLVRCLIQHAGSIGSDVVILGVSILYSILLVGIGLMIGVMVCRSRGIYAPRTCNSKNLNDLPSYFSTEKLEPEICEGAGSDV